MGLNVLIGGVSQVVLVVKNPPANAGDIRDLVLIPGLRRVFLPGELHGQKSVVATVQRAAKSRA